MFIHCKKPEWVDRPFSFSYVGKSYSSSNSPQFSKNSNLYYLISKISDICNLIDFNISENLCIRQNFMRSDLQHEYI